MQEIKAEQNDLRVTDCASTDARAWQIQARAANILRASISGYHNIMMHEGEIVRQEIILLEQSVILGHPQPSCRCVVSFRYA